MNSSLLEAVISCQGVLVRNHPNDQADDRSLAAQTKTSDVSVSGFQHKRNGDKQTNDRNLTFQA